MQPRLRNPSCKKCKGGRVGLVCSQGNTSFRRCDRCGDKSCSGGHIPRGRIDEIWREIEEGQRVTQLMMTKNLDYYEALGQARQGGSK